MAFIMLRCSQLELIAFINLDMVQKSFPLKKADLKYSIKTSEAKQFRLRKINEIEMMNARTLSFCFFSGYIILNYNSFLSFSRSHSKQLRGKRFCESLERLVLKLISRQKLRGQFSIPGTGTVNYCSFKF